MKKCEIVKINGLYWLVWENEFVYKKPYRYFKNAINKAFALGYFPVAEMPSHIRCKLITP